MIYSRQHAYYFSHTTSLIIHRTCFSRSPVLHRCIPTGKDAPLENVKDMYALLNSWSAGEQLLSDLYKTWPLMIILCIAALVLSVMLITMLHWLTKIISWIICIFVVLASIAITAVLWYTWYTITHKTDLERKYSLLEEIARNETAIYCLAIIATVVMVSFLVLV